MIFTQCFILSVGPYISLDMYCTARQRPDLTLIHSKRMRYILDLTDDVNDHKSDVREAAVSYVNL